MDIDSIDRAILDTLLNNSRCPVATLAQKIGLSRNAIQARIDRLESKGIIAGYTLRLNIPVDMTAVKSLLFVKVKASKTPEVLRAVAKMDAAKNVYTTGGYWDVIAELSNKTLADLDNVLSTVREFTHVINTETHILMAHHKGDKTG
ncbi:Lrp/AsnC family transcriptional regulator [Pseudomonas sp. NA-150]|uniref:Lrp/AsnC family transcriptional regulator n=1 Tax=Pseudomonas sp. NA-150 TaxID=3367525 RepID=UPI0037C9904F